MALAKNFWLVSHVQGMESKAQELQVLCMLADTKITLLVWFLEDNMLLACLPCLEHKGAFMHGLKAHKACSLFGARHKLFEGSKNFLSFLKSQFQRTKDAFLRWKVHACMLKEQFQQAQRCKIDKILVCMHTLQLKITYIAFWSGYKCNFGKHKSSFLANFIKCMHNWQRQWL